MTATSDPPDPADAERAADAGQRTDTRRGADAPDPAQAAAPDDVIREPEDVAPDTAEGKSGRAQRVAESGERTDFEAPASTARRAALVYNPTKVDADQLRSQVSAGADAAGWAEPLFFETTVKDLGDDVTRQALRDGVDVVLVAGGDGTVRAVSEAMAGTGVPLAIVPSGTGNLLARNLNLPLTDPQAIIDAAFAGEVAAVDIGRARLRRTDGTVNDHAFVVMAGIGLDAAMIANTNDGLKKSVGWVAYVDGAARSLVGAKPFRALYQIDSHRIQHTRAQSVLFANCGTLPAGIALIPEASVTDGLLDIVVFQPAGWLGWFKVWRRVWWDNSVLRRTKLGRLALSRRARDQAVRYRRGGSAELAVAEPQPVELDGDEFGEATRIACTVDEGALLVCVPAGHDVAKL